MAEFLTAKDVQKLLQVDRSTVYRMAEDGRLPAIRIGRQWRFEADAIRQIIQPNGGGTKTTASEPDLDRPRDESLADLLPRACVQLVQDGFATALDLMIVITDMDGNPITRPSNESRFLTALHAHPQVWQTCIEHWREMAAKPELTPAFTRSSLGLLCARALIRSGRELKGMVFIGGVAPEDWPPAGNDLKQMATTLELPVGLLSTHVADVHYLDPQQQRKALSLVQQIADIISHMVEEYRVH